MNNQTKQWGGRRIARPGRKIGRPASLEPLIRKTVYFYPSDLALLKAINPNISQAIRRLLHKEPTEMERKFAFYSKSFDAGQGIHWIETDATGTILDEWDAPRPGGNHYYANQTKHNIGKNIKELRGSGFRKARLTDENYIAFLESRN